MPLLRRHTHLHTNHAQNFTNLRAYLFFFIHTHWDLETTKTTFKNNIILRAHLEHSES